MFEQAYRSVVCLADFKVFAGAETSEGIGSGVVWDKLGHLVTNYHCVALRARDTTGTQVRLSCEGGFNVRGAEGRRSLVKTAFLHIRRAAPCNSFRRCIIAGATRTV